MGQAGPAGLQAPVDLRRAANNRLRDVGNPRAGILLLRAQGQKIGSQAVNHAAKFS